MKKLKVERHQLRNHRCTTLNVSGLTLTLREGAEGGSISICPAGMVVSVATLHLAGGQLEELRRCVIEKRGGTMSRGGVGLDVFYLDSTDDFSISRHPLTLSLARTWLAALLEESEPQPAPAQAPTPKSPSTPHAGTLRPAPVGATAAWQTMEVV